MKMFKLLTITALAVAALSCSKPEFYGDNEGMGTLNIGVQMSEMTRSSADTESLMSDATVKIYKADFSGLVRSYTYSTITSPLYLAADSYRVDVEAGEAVKSNPAVASWNSKSYKGSQTFNIVAGQVTDVQVVASVNNAVTKISFDESVADAFQTGYSLSIGLGTGAELVYDSSKSGNEGYFIVSGLIEPELTWTFTGTVAKDGSQMVKTGAISNVLPGKLYKMSLKYTVKDGDLDLTLMVDKTTDIIDDTIIFEPVSTGLTASTVYEIWAAHATLHADVDPNENAGAAVQFAYSTNETDWTYVDGVNDAEGTWKAELTGLTPSTEYSYALVINGQHTGATRTFVTDAAPIIPNGSFEYVSLVSGEKYYKFYDPNCGVEEGMTKFWGSGNGEGSEGVNGSASMGVIITDIDTNDKVHGSQSLLAKNGEKLGMLTAGNIFTGDFAELIVGGLSGNGGKVNFGRPWTSRPTAMKLYCKYSTGKMDIVNGSPAGLNLSTNDYDRAQIKVAIGTWAHGSKGYGGTKQSPVQVNTLDESTFVDFYTDPSTIANGELIIYNDGYEINKGGKQTATTTSWIEYTIPLNYHTLEAFPTHIIVSCSSSHYGDYFTGYSGAQLKIDAVELIYE